jgi:hypothetical protein
LITISTSSKIQKSKGQKAEGKDGFAIFEIKKRSYSAAVCRLPSAVAS